MPPLIGDEQPRRDAPILPMRTRSSLGGFRIALAVAILVWIVGIGLAWAHWQ